MSTAADRAIKPATLRKQRQRARAAAVADIEYVREDWALFLDPRRLPQKAGCPSDRLRAVILKELVDNALDVADATATPTLAQAVADRDSWMVSDDGPGLDRAKLLRLFAVNRPLVTTKLLRRPTRGAIGNGLRVVTGGRLASRGTLTVESRGRRYVLDVDRATGETVAKEEGESEVAVGTRVTVAFGPALPRRDDDGSLALLAIRCAGPAAEPMRTHPDWYDDDAFAELVAAAPAGTTLGALAGQFGIDAEADSPARAGDLALLQAAAPR